MSNPRHRIARTLRPLTLCMIAMKVAAAPAPQPDVKPALDTPEVFQRVYTAAVNARDRDALRSMFRTHTPAQRAFAEAFVDSEIALAALAAAVTDAFGTPLIGGGNVIPADPAVHWKVVGNRAEIEPTRGRWRSLVRVNGEYGIDLFADERDWPDKPGGREELADCRRETAERLHAVNDIHSGILRSPDDVRLMVGEPVLQRKPGAPQLPAAMRPATRPVKVDLTAPLAAYESYAAALREGDWTAMRACVVITDPKDEPLEDAFGAYVASSARLWLAAARRFGAEAADDLRVVPLPDGHSEGLQLSRRLKESAPRINGDDAVIENLSTGSGELTRIDGKWRIRSRPTKPDGLDEGANDWPKILTLGARMNDGFAAQIESGEYRTLEEARAAATRAANSQPPPGEAAGSAP